MAVKIGNALAIGLVVVVYAFVAGSGSFDFPRLGSAEESDYASLGEGFRRGHLYMSRTPDPKLLALPYPYDPKARDGIWYWWDDSLFNGRYYLYFTPLPVLIGHLPYRLVRGAWPPDSLIGLLFAIWAFLAAVAFAHRALALSGRARHIPFALWIVFIGLGNAVPFVLAELRMYEVAILTATAMTAMWALALLRWYVSPSIGRAVWVGVWLALAIAARPNLGVLLFVTAAAMLARRISIRGAIAVLAPLGIVAAAMIWYNVARFHQPFEFGHRYQLTSVDMAGKKVCTVCGLPELARFVNHTTHYLFWPLTLRSRFPFVDLVHARLDRAVVWASAGGSTEQVVGIGPLMPLVLAATFFAILFLLGLGRGSLDPVTRATLYVMAGAWLILFGIASCWWVVTRYALDFMLLFAASTVVCIEAGLSFLRDAGVRILPLRIAVAALAIYSIILGFLLGFGGQADAFKRRNPERFETISRWFS